MTVLEVIKKSSEFLTRHGVESPRLQIELMLSHLLAMPRLNLYLQFERVLGEAELGRLREMVQRRGRREPLQQILGSTSFCGIEIGVSRAVLIPRPETEILAERAWRWLNIRSESKGAAAVCLDLCTGSGCLALAVAGHCQAAEIHASDISPEALVVARSNVTRLGFPDRVQFHEGDLFSALPEGRKFDLIISNPPYIPKAVIGSLEPEVRDYDPRLALDGGDDGLDFYRRIAREGAGWLESEGVLMLEIGDGQGAEVKNILEEEKWIVTAIVPDYSQRERIVEARRNA